MNELKVLQYFGHKLPKVDRASGIANRVLKPLYNRKKREVVVTNVLGLKMELNPNETVDGNLIFCPQLYDYNEVKFLLENLNQDDCFIDVGANVGFYSLMASKRTSNILAIEASPKTFNILKKNIALNDLTVNAINIGLSDKEETLMLSKEDGRNSGGQSFINAGIEGIEVKCQPLLKVLEKNNIKKIKLMKMDIEGFEYKVLKPFLINSAKSLYPKYIIVEFRKKEIESSTGNQIKLLEEYGYKKIFEFKSTNVILEYNG